MTEAEAREKSVCRICGKAVQVARPTLMFPETYRVQIWPEELTLNYGKEFAHTDCVTQTIEDDPFS